jgi:trimeric autotransporter adhesin
MKKILLALLLVQLSLFFVMCSSHKKENNAAKTVLKNEDGIEAEEEDGIREAQEMEFELTKDVRLGYVPADRLVKAYNNIVMERRAGRYSRISALNWTERGPNNNTVGPSNGNIRGPLNNSVVSGRMRAIHVDLNDATNRTVWAASVSGGLWKTTNITASPATWILVNDFIGNLAISSVCQDPVNKNIMYFATGERNNNIDAVRGGGIWKSTDNGVTWNLLANTVNFWNTSKIVCDAAGNVYVGTAGNNQGLRRSTDGGTTWTNITPSTPGNGNVITDLRVSSTGRMHVTMGNGSANGSGSFYTDNPSTVTSGGWNSPLTPIPNLVNNCEITVAGNVLYALPEGPGALTPQIYKSINGGVDWSPTLTSPPSSTSEPTINAGQGWYDLAIGVDPNNTNIVVAGGLNFYRTTNGGDTWTQITRWVGSTFNYVHADHHGVVWNGSQVLLATDGGIFYSSDNGVSYTDRNVGMRVMQFYACAIHPVTTNYFLGGTQDNGTHQMTSAGLGGSVEVLGGDGGFCHIDEDEPQFQYGSFVRSQYRRSTNSGASWTSVNFSGSIGQFINPTDYDDINNRMYTGAGTGAYVLWANPQNGSTFTTISISSATPNSIRSFKVSPFTPNRVYMGSAGGGIVKVDDAHTTAPIATNIAVTGMPATTVASINTGTSDNFLIATYTNYGVPHVWITTNGGTSWSNVNGNLPDVPVRWAMFYPEDNDKAIIATEMGIFETTDLNGASTVWVQNGTFPNVKTNMLQYRINDNTILAATHGRGLWTTVFTPTSPFVRFNSSYTYSRVNAETTSATTGCRNYRDYTLNMHIDKAPSGDATVTLNVAGSALEGIDYDITTNGSFTAPSKVLTFPNGATADRPITIRVYDDASFENAESFTISYTISGSTNAVAAPSSLSYLFTIGDNDIVPTGGVTAVETNLNSTRTNDVRGAGLFYFYSSGNRIIAQTNSAAATLGCVSATITEAGTTWQSFLGGNRSQKVVDITTASNPGTAYTIGLYVTAAELAGKTPATLQLTGTTAATIAGANGSNTMLYTTTVTAFGSDYLFTAVVSSSAAAKFFLSEGVTTSLFDRNITRENFAKLLANPVQNNVPLFVSNQSGKKIGVSLFAENGQLLKSWQPAVLNGNVNLSLNHLYVLPGVYVLRLDADNRTQTIKLVKQ